MTEVGRNYGEYPGMTEKGFPIAVGNDGGGRNDWERIPDRSRE